MAAGNSGVPWSATSSSNPTGRSERAMSMSAVGSFGERTILVATAVSLIWLPELLHVFGKVRRERVRLDRAVGVEAHRQVLADGGRRVPLGVEPAPGLVRSEERRVGKE